MTSEVSQHFNIDRPDSDVSLHSINIMTVENKKFERGVKEAVNI